MLDTHCHLTFMQYAGRVDQVIADARDAGVRGMITVSTTSSNCADGLAIAQRFDNVWCTAGVHPLYADEPRDWEQVKTVARQPECVAWGEMGLDNHYDKPPRDVQDRALSEQLAAIESAAGEGIDLPVVLHCRKAVDELLDVLRHSSLDPRRFVFHCFTSDADDARKVLDFGAWISFTGVVTFRNAPEVVEAAKLVPADRIMVETDAPFLTPEPHRKVFPNEPKYVVDVARFLADLRGVPYPDFDRQVDDNARRFFGLPGAE